MNNSKTKLSILMLVLLVGLGFSYYLFITTKDFENKKQIATFHEYTGDLKDSLQKEIDQVLEVLYSIGSFYEGSAFVDAEEFKIFTSNAIKRHPEIQSVEWVPRVFAKDLKKYQDEYWQPPQKAPTFFIFSPERTKIPAPRKEEYYPITFAEPLDSNQSVIGMDYSSRPLLLEAMNEARDTGNIAASTKVELNRINDKNRNATFLFLPVYEKNKSLDTVEKRREALKGFITIILKAENLINKVFKNHFHQSEILLFCASPKTNENLLYSSQTKTGPQKPPEKDENVVIANKTWILSFQKKSEINSIPYRILILGFIVTLLISYYLYNLINQNTRIQKEVQKQTLHLEEEVERQKQLKENLKLYERALEASPNGIIITDKRLPDNPIIYVNKAFETITGYSAQEAIGKNCRFLKSDQSSPETVEKLRKAIHENTSCHATLINRTKNGRLFTNELSISPIFNNQNQVTHFIGIQQDVTEKEQLQNKLLTRNLLQESILNSANFTIISTDPHGIIKTFNRSAEKLLGYKAEEVIDKVTPEIIHDPQEVIERSKTLSNELKRLIKPGFEVFVAKAMLGIPDNNQWTYIRKDGSRFPVRLSVTSLVSPNGIIIGYLGIGQDLTDEIETRKKIEKYNQMIERFEKVSVGREIEIIQLKKEINKLTEQLGQKAPYKIS